MYLPRGYREHVEDENGDVDKQYSFAILMMTVGLVTKIESFIPKHTCVAIVTQLSNNDNNLFTGFVWK